MATSQHSQRSHLPLVGLLLGIVACGGPTSPSFDDLAGTWWTDGVLSIVTFDFQYAARFRITVGEVVDPSDLSGSWVWGFDYGGGIPAGSISGSAVSLSLFDFDTSESIQFSGALMADGTLSGTLQGFLFSGESVVLSKSN